MNPMLRELHIHNLAVIADARIELAAGLNCFTGATGAGKSLVIGAIELLLGLRAPGDMLRPGVEEARVAGIFDMPDADRLAEIEKFTDAPVAADGGELLLTRRLYASGRSSASLNGNPITLGMLKQLAEYLVDVHGQHDHQYLLKPGNQLDVLDQAAGLLPLRLAYHQTYVQLHEITSRLAELSAAGELRQQQLELFRFQLAEIDAADLNVAEYDELASRASILRNLGKLQKDASATYSALYEADGAILERLKMMVGVLAELSELDGGLKPIAASVRESTMQLEESAFDLSRYIDKLDLDPSESAEVDDRLNTINRILSKYGRQVADVLELRDKLTRQIDSLTHADLNLAELNRQLKPLQQQLIKQGKTLSEARQKAARTFAPQVESQLGELGMEKARFTIAINQVLPGDDFSQVLPSGFDQVEFTAQTNPGQTPLPLRRIASGGELSRIMLAIKGILAHGDRISVLVFDEIDSNVGGRLGSIIGRKLRGLAEHHQILCITHLPQIASYADRHLTVRKQVTGNVTHTTVRSVDGPERLEELAEMISGSRITDVTRAQANELLAMAQSEFARPIKLSPARGESLKAQAPLKDGKGISSAVALPSGTPKADLAPSGRSSSPAATRKSQTADKPAKAAATRGKPSQKR